MGTVPGGGDNYLTWESLLLGSVPIVHNTTGLYPLFKQGPILPFNDWSRIESTDLREFSVEVERRSRKLVMAQFWFDQIHFFAGKKDL